MPEDTAHDVGLEIAHVLFIDVVGYSKLLTDQQRKLLAELNRIVRESDAYRKAESAGKLIKLPTGDGMVLAFFTTPDAPARCAMAISRVLKEEAAMPVRMGIHSGPVEQMSHVDDRPNLAGAGINIAQRVMNCGDAGHILLSTRSANDLAEIGEWKAKLHPIGEVDVKHGVPIGIVNLHDGEVGNPNLPQRVREAALRAGKAKRRRIAMSMSILFIGAAAIGLWLNARSIRLPNEKGIAILPFENLSPQKENALLASGLQDEIITRLAKVASLKVISRTSTMGLGTRPSNLASIAKELGVGAILEGSVQRIGEQLRVNVQLITAATGASIWAETYDRQLVDVFSVESEIATQVASALRATLTPEEKARVAKVPTENTQAYTFYRRAREIQQGISDTRADYEEKRRLLEQAVAVEPTFALGHAELSDVLTSIYEDLDRTEEIKTVARAHAEKALQLDVDLGEAHKALGSYFYRAERDYPAAQREFDIALKALPNDSELIRWRTLMLRRQGHWAQAIPNLRRAVALDPRNLQAIDWLANTYLDLKEYMLAEQAKQRVLDVTISMNAPPDSVLEAKLAVADVNATRTGSLAMVKKVLSEVPAGYDPEGMITDVRSYFSLIGRDYAEAQRTIDGYSQSYIQRAGGTRQPKAIYQANIALAQGDMARAKPFLQTALAFFQTELQKEPLSEQVHMDVALTNAFLGRKDDALREGRRAGELLPESVDARAGAFISNNLAVVYAWTGETDEALNLIERLLTTPAGENLTDLRSSWMWDPLRNDPRFKKIVAGPEPKVIYN